MHRDESSNSTGSDDAPYCAIGWQRFSADHPALPGHFPGRPIIPGVVILQQVHELLHQHWPQHVLCALPTAKFLRPSVPGELLLLGIEPGASTEQDMQGRFICRSGTQTVVQGTLIARYTAGT